MKEHFKKSWVTILFLRKSLLRSNFKFQVLQFQLNEKYYETFQQHLPTKNVNKLNYNFIQKKIGRFKFYDELKSRNLLSSFSFLQFTSPKNQFRNQAAYELNQNNLYIIYKNQISAIRN